jgi:hypothetical protein
MRKEGRGEGRWLRMVVAGALEYQDTLCQVGQSHGVWWMQRCPAS